MDSSGSASSYKLQLALAALVGASSAAVAAYYLHYRAVAQVARSASTNRRRTRPPAPAPGAGAGRKLSPPRRAAVGSASLPDLSAFYEAGGRGGGGLASGGYLVEEEEEDDAHGVVGPHANDGALERAELLDIPQGLPRLNVGPDGSKQFARTVSTRRVEIIRPKSPKSPAVSASADGSGDAIQNSDNGYMNTNGNLEGEHKGNAIVENGAAKPLAAASLMRSKSISNGLHAVQPDPVAADIL